MAKTTIDTAIGRVIEAFTRLVPANVPTRKGRVRANDGANGTVTKVAAFTDNTKTREQA